MATRIESVRNLVGVQSLAFIRAIQLKLELKAARPNAKMNIFFDGVNVNFRCKLTDSSDYGANISTDSTGSLTVLFDVPGGTFTTGTKIVYVTDSPSIEAAEINGSVYGKATARFTSSGIQEIYQETVTITDIQQVFVNQMIPTVTEQLPAQGTEWGAGGAGGDGGGGDCDPLAQSFFTFGVTGGCFLTSIDIYFNTRDPEGIPVTLDIRPLINGYPKTGMVGDPDLVCVMQANDVKTSNDASVPTNFKFKVPIYLNSDTEYCFVLMSASNQYNIFTSKLGEVSFENKQIIFEQPYIGSLFKSENNSTWTAEQFEDIKFTLNIAKFDTGTIGHVNIKTNAVPFGVNGTYLSTTLDSNEIVVTQTVQHGFEVGRMVHITGDQYAVYNGILSENITGLRRVTKIIDEYTYAFNADGNDIAIATGPITTGGQIKSIVIDNKGMNYDTAPTVVISAPPQGTMAEAEAVIDPVTKTIVAINVTRPGNGYITAPTIQITGGGGVLGAATAIIDATFTIFSNKPVDFIIPGIPNKQFVEAPLSAMIRSAQLNYSGGSLSSYNTYQLPVELNVNGRTELPSHSVITSEHDPVIGRNYSTILEYQLRSTNPNVSPVMDLRNNPKLIAYNNRLRSHAGEDIENGGDSGSVSDIFTTINPGTGYSTPPTVEVIGDCDVPATVIAILGSAGVTNITDIVSSTDFTSTPTVTIADPQTPGVTATAVAILKDRNIIGFDLAWGGLEYPNGVTPEIQISGGGPFASGAEAYAEMGLGARDIWITNGGIGYDQNTVTVTIDPPTDPTGRQATARAIVDSSSAISRIQITDPGSGYTSLPSVIISPPAQWGTPAVTSTIVPTRTIKRIVMVNGGSNYEVAPTVVAVLPKGISGGSLYQPAIINPVLSTAAIDRIVVTNGGSGYTTEPLVLISGGGGTSASAVSEISGKSIQRLELNKNVANPGGSGYTTAPTLKFIRTDGSTGVDAIFLAKLSGFNSERSNDRGIGLSRYITKTYTIETISTGINLFSEIYSTNETSVEWYIRVSKSNSSQIHANESWKYLKCDTKRNRSSKRGEKFDYKFYLYDLPEFDTYDLKCVMRSYNPAKSPIVYNFRSILIA